MDKDQIKQILKDNYKVLSNEYGVSRIGIFGSVAKGTMTEESDLDIVVEFRRPIGFKFNNLVEYLENLFEKKVDVITTDGIKNIRIKEVARNIEKNVIYV